MASRDEKIFPALPNKRRRAREEGRIARSRDLTSAVSFLACAALVSGASVLLGRLGLDAFRNAFSAGASDDLGVSVARALRWPLGAALVLGAGLAAASVAGALLQDGLVFTPARIAPDLSRLNPLKYFERIFSTAGLVEFAKAGAKVVVLALIAWKTALWALETGANAQSISQALWTLAASLRSLFLWSSVLALIVAGADYAHKRYEYEAELRMSRQEFLDEMKQEQGNPLVRRALRRAQRKNFRRIRGIHQAATASVVLRNPSHYAVAVRYRRGFDRAPLIVAKGAGETAHRVVAMARLAAVPIIENKPLARALYKAVEVGDYIPRHFYRAVAEVLAAIMRAEARRRAQVSVSA
jgi:flagellar biosynthesis protein FlhB